MRQTGAYKAKNQRDRVLRVSTAAALILMLALTGAALAACGGGTTDTTASAEITLQTTTPAGTGTLDHITWNLPQGEPPTLDPMMAGDYHDEFMCGQIYDTLVHYGPDYSLNPGIAESWEQVDPVTLVFTIRQDAKFWDGNPVTADDVVFSLGRQTDPAAEGIWYGLFSRVASVEKTGPWEVTVTFIQPHELFLREMGTGAGAVVEQAFVTQAGADYGSGNNVMASGPYKLVSWTSGANIELEANADYWDPNLKPKVQAITVEFLSDTSTINSALLSGEIDGMYEVPSAAIPALREATSGKLYYGPGLITTAVVPVNPEGPMGNANIRKALFLAIDRQVIVDSVFYGAATINKTITPPTAWDTDPAARKVYEQAYAAMPGDKPDIEAAKALVAAETGTDQTMTLGYVAGNQDMLQMVSIVQQGAKDIGLTVELKPMQPLDYSNAWYIPEYRQGIDMLLTIGFQSIPDPLDLLPMVIGPYAFFNWIGWSGPAADESWAKIDLAGQTYDPVERANLVVEAQTLYSADTISIPLTSNDELLFMNNRISGAPVSFAYLYMHSFAMLGGTE
jgi:peptide/nickel transport system substrate-binding protein